MIEHVGACEDSAGDTVTFYLDDDNIMVEFYGEVGDYEDGRGTVTMCFDAETREHFNQLWARAALRRRRRL